MVHYGGTCQCRFDGESLTGLGLLDATTGFPTSLFKQTLAVVRGTNWERVSEVLQEQGLAEGIVKRFRGDVAARIRQDGVRPLIDRELAWARQHREFEEYLEVAWARMQGEFEEALNAACEVEQGQDVNSGDEDQSPSGQDHQSSHHPEHVPSPEEQGNGDSLPLGLCCQTNMTDRQIVYR